MSFWLKLNAADMIPLNLFGSNNRNMVLDKSDMTEEDVKLQYITPAILAKWDCGHVTMETKNSEAQYE